MRQFNDSTIQQSNSDRGYTLIELMVAIGVFSIVVGVMSTSLITSLRGQKKSYTAQNVFDSARYAMEMMTREIRMGAGFPSPATGNSIQFISTMPHRDGKTVTFYLDITNNLIMFDDDTADAVPPTPITSSNIAVIGLSFKVADDQSTGHSRITIVMRAESVGTQGDVKTSLDLQTTISPRRL